MLGWEENDQPAQYQKASQIKPNDRIAIKRMKGGGQTGIKIFHLGIIKGVILVKSFVLSTGLLPT